MNNLNGVAGSRLTQQRTTGWADFAGMFASLGCAIHCAAMPMLIGYLPSLGLAWIADEIFHKWMAVICAALAFLAFVPGWKRHRNIAPVLLGSVGIASLSSAAFLLEACCDHDVPNHSAISQSNITQSVAAVACHDCESCARSAVSAPVSSTPLSKQIVPYMHPFGGLILIAAHLLNHRVTCRCCGGDAASGEL